MFLSEFWTTLRLLLILFFVPPWLDRVAKRQWLDAIKSKL